MQAAPVAPSSPLPCAPEPRIVIQHIVNAGAILHTPGRTTGDLVGDWRWQSDNSVFWFTAFGDAVRDGHCLHFESLQFVRSYGVCFYREGTVAAYLTTIAAAHLEDPDDYRVAWQLWQQVAPLQRNFIAQCYRELTGSEGEWSHDGP